MTVREIEIHPGHWKNTGSGANSILNEVTEARRVARRVYDILRSWKVPTTYFEDNVSTNQTQNINTLVKEHNKDNDALVVSVHFNAGGDSSKAIGTEVLYYDQQALAARISKAISNATGGGLLNRGAKNRTDLGVLARTHEPAILIEVCFVNSKIDAAIYRRDFEKICQAIAKELAAEVKTTSTTDKKTAFLNKVTSDIKDCWSKHQILPSVVLAQAILESDWGTSDKALQANNLFGIKAASDWTGPTVTLPTKEYVNNKWIFIDAKWRKYENWTASIMDHANFLITRKHYKNIIGETDYKKVCNELQKAGYATDPTYANKLIVRIEQYNLTKYDEVVDDLVFSSPTLKAETETTLASKLRRQMIVDAAVVAGANKAHWQGKLDNGTITEADLLGLATKAVVNLK